MMIGLNGLMRGSCKPFSILAILNGLANNMSIVSFTQRQEGVLMVNVVFLVSRIIGYCIFAYGFYLALFVQTFTGPDAMAASSIIVLSGLFITLPRIIENRMAKNAVSRV